MLGTDPKSKGVTCIILCLQCPAQKTEVFLTLVRALPKNIRAGVTEEYTVQNSYR